MTYIQGNNGSFAQSATHESWLSTEFGESYARKIFGSELVDTLPRYVKGKRKGQLKGMIVWRKVIKGGWISNVGVVAPGKTYAHGIWETPFGEQPKLIHGFNAYDRDEAASSLRDPEIVNKGGAPFQGEEKPVLTDEQKQAYASTIAKAREMGFNDIADIMERTVGNG